MNQFGLQLAKGFVANNILALHLKGAEKLLKNQYTVIVQSKRGPLLCFQLVGMEATGSLSVTLGFLFGRKRKRKRQRDFRPLTSTRWYSRPALHLLSDDHPLFSTFW